MARVAVVLLADTETPGDMGRMANAFSTAAELKENGDDFRFILDGAGTKWIAALADPSHKYHDDYREVKGSITGACQYCSNAYGVKQKVVEEGITLLNEHRGHPSLRRLAEDGYQVITF
ncbi:MAG: hypothetical protein ACOCTG_02540 [Bacteroidota bacterium]